MNPAAILFYPFDWRGVLGRAAYRRNLAVLVLVGLLVDRLDLLSGAASYGWTALAAAIGLSFDARRYHDMGRSAAWIVWANAIAAILAIVAFQFIPNVLDYIPLPEDWRPDSTGVVVLGRFALPALVGLVVGNVAQSLWLATAPSAAGDNPYARAAASPRLADEGRGDGPDEAALQAMINRHIAKREVESRFAGASAAPPERASGFQARRREFGRRGGSG